MKPWESEGPRVNTNLIGECTYSSLDGSHTSCIRVTLTKNFASERCGSLASKGQTSCARRGRKAFSSCLEAAVSLIHNEPFCSCSSLQRQSEHKHTTKGKIMIVIIIITMYITFTQSENSLKEVTGSCFTSGFSTFHTQKLEIRRSFYNLNQCVVCPNSPKRQISMHKCTGTQGDWEKKKFRLWRNTPYLHD